MSWTNRMRACLEDDHGQDLLEYALLVTLLVLVAIVAVTATGLRVDGMYTYIVARVPA